MFTGIVQTQGRIVSLETHDSGARLVVERGTRLGPVAKGDSVCVSGVCLTAAEIGPETVAFDVIVETLNKTKLGDLKMGDTVNLEAAVTPNQPLGGHFMQGHVDGVGTVDSVRDDGVEHRITIQPPVGLLNSIVAKGSIAIDGVSLTIASLNPGQSFDVALIPETCSRTTLGHISVGTRLNIEADIVSKTVVHWLERTHKDKASPAGVTMDLLSHAGFAER